jgi:hypothetical protein
MVLHMQVIGRKKQMESSVDLFTIIITQGKLPHFTVFSIL